jgi:hypothetical protein
MARKDKWTAILWIFFSVLILSGPGGLRAQAPSSNAQSAPASRAIVTPATPTVAPPPDYPQTAEGFDAQMSAALAAYQKGDGPEGRRLLEQFRMPDSPKWFAEEFGPDLGKTLSKLYDQHFESYLDSMGSHLEEVASAKGRKLNMRLEPGTSQQPTRTEELSGFVPSKPPACFNVFFVINLTGKKDLAFKGEYKGTTWEDTFLYQDGAFRFMGHGAWPFWIFKIRS